MEDLNSVINSPAALKKFSASNEDSGNVCTQFFNFLKAFGHSWVALKNIISFLI